MCNSIAAAAAIALLWSASSTTCLTAQDTSHHEARAASATRTGTENATATATATATSDAPTPNDSSTIHFARYRKYPWNGVNVWLGDAYETRSASHNEHFAGSMRILGIQISRDIWRGQRGRVMYLGEVLPVMLVRSGPPVNRIPDTLRVPLGYYNQAELDRFKYRNAYGFGIAPLGMEASYQTSTHTSALFNITAGALLFTKIVPYGRGTQPNFTVSPGVALQWEPAARMRVAIGYTFHHLSNASFGQANPGMNSQILYLRFSHLRKQ